ncbi:MAG: DEAD/DEAH box helicase, partial [Deltaproteobacteria bacterium]|nr:DEAD/DEAH box helicase [Deltaproteobacteria bacterium]
MPELTDKKPGIAFFVANSKSRLKQRFCSCTVSEKRTCSHILKLMHVYKMLNKGLNEKSIEADFNSTIWHRLASIMAENASEKPSSVSIRSVVNDVGHDPSEAENNREKFLKVFNTQGEEILSYFSQGADSIRFVERIGKIPEEDTVPSRGSVLDQLVLLTLTDNERLMNKKGFKTRGQAIRESFWFRLAYHGYREFGASGCSFHPAVEEATGTFTVTCDASTKELENRPVFRMIVPRSKVKRLILAFKEFLPNQHDLAIHPIPLRSIFKVTTDTKLDLEVRPIVEFIQEDGEKKYLEREDIERFRYGDLIYIKELGLLAELEKAGNLERKFKSPIKMVLKKSQVPSFLEEFRHDLTDCAHLVDENVKALKIFRKIDHVEITSDAIDRDWCWLSVKYGFGNTSISLADILQAKEEGQRFINTDGGWVDCKSPELDGLDAILTHGVVNRGSSKSDKMQFSRMGLFRMRAALPEDVHIKGNGKSFAQFEKVLDLQPLQSAPKLKGVISILRPYQKLGVEWIRFLFENGLGGLLCDDMGLGKTHEVMHFLAGLKEHDNIKGPFLVVCPTTVLGHWRTKIREHAPVLEPVIYHGNQRNLEEAVDNADVLITSYGVLRNDIEKLESISFPVAVFDEVQYVKNSQTQIYSSAKDIRAGMKLGLTGTPIENSLTELKAILDLTLPGYLGTDNDFESRYIKPIELNSDRIKQKELSRLILPFMLRRKKDTVL